MGLSENNNNNNNNAQYLPVTAHAFSHGYLIGLVFYFRKQESNIHTMLSFSIKSLECSLEELQVGLNDDK